MCCGKANKKIAQRGVSWLDSSAVVEDVTTASTLVKVKVSFRPLFEEAAIVRPLVPAFQFPLHRATSTLVMLLQTFAAALYIE